MALSKQEAKVMSKLICEVLELVVYTRSIGLPFSDGWIMQP